MTANDVLNNALGLLGYAENNGNRQLTQRILQKALPLVNLVYGDIARIEGLKKQRLESLTDKIELSDKAIDVFVCGVAAYIAGSEGDENTYIAANTTEGAEVKDIKLSSNTISFAKLR